VNEEKGELWSGGREGRVGLEKRKRKYKHPERRNSLGDKLKKIEE